MSINLAIFLSNEGYSNIFHVILFTNIVFQIGLSVALSKWGLLNRIVCIMFYFCILPYLYLILGPVESTQAILSLGFQASNLSKKSQTWKFRASVRLESTEKSLTLSLCGNITKEYCWKNHFEYLYFKKDSPSNHTRSCLGDSIFTL